MLNEKSYHYLLILVSTVPSHTLLFFFISKNVTYSEEL